MPCLPVCHGAVIEEGDSVAQTFTTLTLRVLITGIMMDTMKGLDIAEVMTDESMTDHGEPDTKLEIRVPVVDGKEITPGRVHNSPDILQDLQ